MNKRRLSFCVFACIAIALFVSSIYFVFNKSDIELPLVAKPKGVNGELVVRYELKVKHQIEQAAIKSGKVVTYSVAVRGNIKSDLDEFRDLASETLNSLRGWIKAGVYFKEIAGDADFNLILSEARYLPSYSSICSTKYSCRIGKNVIINDDRWSGASEAWNAKGGSLRDYRHMVINHETGHFLGHRDNVPVCSGPGAKAPLMQQQSIDLRGCIFNPWPLDQELWTNR